MADNDVKTPVLPKPQPKATKTIDQWGNVDKRKRNVDLGLSGIVLPPYIKKGTATYRGIHMATINPSSTFKEPPDPQTILLPGTYLFYDRGEPDPTKRNIMMKNITGAGEIVIDPVTKKQVVEDRIDLVEMLNGIKKVNIETQYRLYVFMELHPMNKSNKFRDQSIQAAFERTDLETNKSSAYRQAEMDLGFDAEAQVMKMGKDDIIGYATSCGIPTMEHGGTRPLIDVKSDLRVFARKDPRNFFSKANNVAAAVRMNVHDALNFGLIEYVADKRTFIVPEQDDEAIFNHLPDEDPYDALIQYMASSEGKNIYTAMNKMIEYWR